MAQARPSPERIDLARADDPRDVIHRVVACLAQGGVVALPTGSGPGLAAALHPDAVGRLLRTRPGTGDRPVLAVKGADEVTDWAPGLSPAGHRLSRRGWPGPLTLAIAGGVDRGLARRLPADVRDAVVADGVLYLRSPAHPLVQEVLRLVPGPILLADGGPPSTLDARGVGDELDMIVDDAPTRGAGPATVVRVGPEGWRVVRPGVIAEADIVRMAGTILLFVCTGNTCRSPMAEALCKALLAERLGCQVDDLEGRGYVVLSAGLAATDGMPAAAHAAEAVRARGGSLGDHASRRITAPLARMADLIVTMTREHADALLAHLPEVAPRTRLLHPRGGDVDDPIGTDRENYRRTAEEIVQYLGPLLDELNVEGGPRPG